MQEEKMRKQNPQTDSSKAKKKEMSGFLKGVEVIGNKLPHPAMLFLMLALIVVVISHFVVLHVFFGSIPLTVGIER